MQIHTLHQKAKEIAIQYKKSEQELVSIIAQVDQLKGFYKLGFNSLFTYMTEGLGLGLTAAVASNISAVVRKSYEVPQLKEKVITGELSLSKARKLTPVIDQMNKNQWLSLAQSKTQKQIEREVALAQPKTAVQERTQYIPNDRIITEKVQIKRDISRMKLELGVSEKLMLQLRRCQDLESQRKKKHVSLEECLEGLAQRQKIKGKLKEKFSGNDTQNLPRKAKEASTTRNLHNSSSVSDRSNHRTPIPAKIKHQVQLRDQGQCTYVDQEGKRCSSRRYLEIHHNKPVSQGGDNSLQNLKLLCSGHHKAHHL